VRDHLMVRSQANWEANAKRRAQRVSVYEDSAS
jgi:hypothetical protein